MASPSKQRLALAICDFLTTSAADGTLAADDKDSIDVAVNCIAESFKVDPQDKDALAAATGSQNLLQIYSVYEKIKPNAKPSASPTVPTATPSAAAPSEDDKKKAEDLKAQGNRAMAAKDHSAAIDFYTRALALHPGNAIYLSNRAAAHSATKDHQSAVADAEAAVAIDPAYTKAWSRLGLARFVLGDARGSMEAYKAGIDHEGSGGSEAMRKGYETAKKRVDELESEAASGADPSAASRSPPPSTPDLGGLASMLGGGGGGGGGGMPDLSSIMSNPMFANMAQNLMSNPDMMQNLMSNPRLRQMAEQFGGGGGGGGGGMPDLGSLMNDPNIADMARNMMGGGGGGAGGAGAGRGAGDSQ